MADLSTLNWVAISDKRQCLFISQIYKIIAIYIKKLVYNLLRIVRKNKNGVKIIFCKKKLLFLKKKGAQPSTFKSLVSKREAVGSIRNLAAMSEKLSGISETLPQ